MKKSLIIIGKQDNLQIIQDFGLELHEISLEDSKAVFDSLRKSGRNISDNDLIVAACCVSDYCFGTFLRHRHEIACSGLEVFICSFDDNCISLEDFKKCGCRVLAEIIVASPATVPKVRDFKLKEESIMASIPKEIFEETVRLPKERQYFVPRD